MCIRLVRYVLGRLQVCVREVIGIRKGGSKYV